MPKKLVKTSTPPDPLAVTMKPKKAKKKKDRIVLHIAPGGVRIEGRPGWSTRAKKIKVNQTASKGELEDRRHLLHWDEQLKPVLDRVFSALQRDYPLTLEAELKGPLLQRGLQRLLPGAAALMERVVVEINGAQGNLIADRADINKAIEHVRENLRQYASALKSDEQYAAEFTEHLGATPNDQRMKAYQAMARKYLPADRFGTPILSRISEIHAMLLGMIDGCPSPSALWVLVFDATYSVTFDLSAKSAREQTAKALAWQQRMRSNFDADGRQQYADLLTLLD